MARIRPLITLFLLLVVPALPGMGQGPDRTAGNITALAGTATIKRAGIERELHPVEGDDLLVGDELAAAAGSAVQMTFPDGDFLNLFPGSAVRVDYYVFDAGSKRRAARIKVLRGRARFVLYKVPGSGSGFHVETGSAAVVPDLLSDFAVTIIDAGTEVAALRRSVRVRNNSSLIVGEIKVDMNERTIVRHGSVPERPVTFSLLERKDYTKDIRRYR